jgi:hypothetical protein
MLKIKCVSREELINALTQSKGNVADNYAVISIYDKDTQPIIGNRSNVLSIMFRPDTFGNDLLPLNEGIRIFNFIKEVVAEKAKSFSDSYLIVQSESGISRAGAIAAFAAEIITPHDIIDFDFYLEKNLVIQPNKLILEKLYTIKLLIENFSDELKNLPYIAYQTWLNATGTLKQEAGDYLENVFKLSTKELKEKYLFMKAL